MAEKHHKVASPKQKPSLLRKAYIAALSSLLSLLGFSSCATSKKQQKLEEGPEPRQVERPDPARRPVLMYGPPPTRYKSSTEQSTNAPEPPMPMYGPPPAPFRS